MEPIISFRKIDKKFGGIYALRDVSFDIRRGEVHALVGENGAGKSTLMNILSGMLQPDGGEVYLNGKKAVINSPVTAKKMGISTVYQELKLCNELTVAENVFLGCEIRRHKIGMNRQRMEEETGKILDSYGLEIDPSDKVGNYSVAQMQVVEIARAISLNSDVLILDEPTSSLTENETRKLFSTIETLKEKGTTIIFISHRLEEIFEISDRISVLRDGMFLKTLETKETNTNEIVTLIAGRSYEELAHDAEKRQELDREVILEVERLSRGKYFHDVGFQLHKHEILGLYGLQGSGRSELIETVFGIYRPDSGEIRLKGRPAQFKNPRQAIANGLAFVPEDRKHAGIFSMLSILENMAVVHDRDISNRLGLIAPQKIAALCGEYIQKLRIKADSVDQKLSALSGGNQQKVVIARGLSTSPEIILMDEPTRGVDVGAKSEIFKILRRLRDEEGKSIIVISSEISEIVNECDRVLVMKQGSVCGELQGDAINKKNILDLAFKGRQEAV